MCQPRKWWIGLLPLAALWFAVNFYALGPLGRKAIIAPTVAIPAETLKPAPQRTQELQALPQVQPQTSPYVFGAEKTAESLILSGFYADDAAHAALLAKARELFPKLRIADQMQRGAGAPNRYLQAALAGLDSLARLQSGRFSLSDHDATLSGEGAETASADAVRSEFIAAMPGGYALTTQLAEPQATASGAPALDARQCEDRLREILVAEPIQFETASAHLKKAAVPVIDRLADVAKLCPTTAFTVAGHTDDVGLPQRKLDLSQRRAENVVRALVGAGIDAGRLTAVGYGDSRPLTGADNEEARAKNRRIELIAK